MGDERIRHGPLERAYSTRAINIGMIDVSNFGAFTGSGVWSRRNER
jgi:hypothetical protein